MSAGARPEEIEVKLPCEDLEGARRRLEGAGARLRAAKHDESNDLYDDSEGRLAREGRALRLRDAGGKAILTFKGPARFERGVKIREEREVEVSDRGEAAAILANLGFTRRFSYEKRREEWDFADCVVALDETPIGAFVEIEGDPGSIRRVVAALELDFADALPYSYARLYSLKRQKDSSLPEDMVFARRE